MRRRAFPGSGPEVRAQYLRAGHWLRTAIYGRAESAAWCKANGVPVVKAASTGVNSAGGFLVPTELASAILDLRDVYGAFRRRARIVPMASDNVVVARRPGGIGAFFIGENSTITETSTLVDELSLTARKIGALIRVSNELEEDGEVDLVDFLANELALAFALKEDDCAFNGDGTNTYAKMNGINSLAIDANHAKAKVTGAHNTFLTLDSTDLGNLLSAVQAAAIPNGAWFCSQTCFATTFCRLAAAAGGGFLESMLVDGISTPFYLGFPVILSQKMPLITSSLSGKVMLAFGDMYLGGVLGQRRSITVARSPERYMDQDEIGVLGTERFHAVIHGMGDNTNTGALAALVGN
jgi:HK97 family phage major capsid protein